MILNRLVSSSILRRKPFLFEKIMAVEACLAAPFLLWRAKSRGRKNASTDPQAPRILVVPQLTRIGDIVCAAPVLRALKEKFPESRTSVLVSVIGKGILENNPHVDELLVYEEYDPSDMPGLIARKRFDAGISLSGTALSAALFVLGRIPKRVKVIKPRQSLAERITDWSATHAVRYTKGIYLPKLYMELLAEAGLVASADVSTKKEIFTDQESDRKASDFLAAHGISKNDTVVGMSLTAGKNKVKEWGVAKYAALAQKIRTAHNCRIVIIGTKSDNRYFDEFRRLYGSDFVLADSFSVKELPSLMRHFSLFISGDTGPAHIAEALDVPLIDIVGPILTGEVTLFNNDRVRAVFADPPIPPTLFIFDPPGDPNLSQKATANTSVDRVYAAVREMLAIA